MSEQTLPAVKVDTAQALKFLRWLYNPQDLLDTDRIFLTAKMKGESGRMLHVPVHPNYLLNTEQGLAVLNQQVKSSEQGMDIYCSMAAFKESSPGKWSRKEEFVSAISCLWADLDFKDYDNDAGKAWIALERLGERKLFPNVVIHSGGGFHAYWKLDRTIRTTEIPLHEIRTRVKWIEKFLGSDHVSDGARVLRLPGTINWKYDPIKLCYYYQQDTGQAYNLLVNFPSEIADLQTSKHVDRLWFANVKPESFDLGSVFEPTIVQQILRGLPAYQELLQINLVVPLTDESWSGLDFRILLACVKAELTPAQILYLWTNREFAIAAYQQEKRGQSLLGYLTHSYNNTLKTFAKESVRGLPAEPPGAPAQVAVNAALNKTFQWRGQGDTHLLYFLKKSKTGEAWKSIANHYLEPLARVYSVEDHTITELRCRYHGPRNETADVVLERRALTTWQNYLEQLPVSATWLGDTGDFQAYLTFIQEREVPIHKGTRVIGWHDETFITPEVTYPDSDIFFMRQGLPFENSIAMGDEVDQKKLNKIIRTMTELHSDPEIWMILGWFFMAPYAAAIRKLFTGFPILLTHGQREAGKTTLLNLLCKLWGNTHGELSALTTAYAITRTVSLTNAVPLFLDEHRGGNTPKILDVYSMLRSAYTAGAVSYGKQKRRGVYTAGAYSLLGPIAVAGEIPFKDYALRDRSIPIRLPGTWLGKNPQSREALKTLNKIGKPGILLRQAVERKNLTGIALDYLKGLDDTLSDLRELAVYSTRLRFNFAVAGAGMMLMADWTNAELQIPDPLATIEKVMQIEHSAYKENLSHAFIRWVNYLIDKNEIRANEHYAFITMVGESQELALDLDYTLAALSMNLRNTENDLPLSRGGLMSIFQDESASTGLFKKVPQKREFGGRTHYCVSIDLKVLKDLGLEIGLPLPVGLNPEPQHQKPLEVPS